MIKLEYTDERELVELLPLKETNALLTHSNQRLREIGKEIEKGKSSLEDVLLGILDHSGQWGIASKILHNYFAKFSEKQQIKVFDKFDLDHIFTRTQLRKVTFSTEIWKVVIKQQNNLRISAGLPTLPIQFIRELAKNTSKWVRSRIARRKKLPIDLVALLAKDASIEVRASIARHQELTIEQIKKFSQDSLRVRMALGSRKDLLAKLVGYLEKDQLANP